MAVRCSATERSGGEGGLGHSYGLLPWLSLNGARLHPRSVHQQTAQCWRGGQMAPLYLGIYTSIPVKINNPRGTRTALLERKPRSPAFWKRAGQFWARLRQGTKAKVCRIRGTIRPFSDDIGVPTRLPALSFVLVSLCGVEPRSRQWTGISADLWRDTGSTWRRCSRIELHDVTQFE